jgi:flagellar protein FlaG
MAVVELNMQPRPVPSSPNVGAAAVRQGNQQQAKAPVSAEQSVQQQVTNTEAKVSEKALRDAVGQANIEMAMTNESISFGFEKKLGLLFVQVTDSNSGEVIREIPSREFIAHRVAMREMVGLLLDKQA